MRFDRKKFYDGLRLWEGELSPQQVAGLNFILDAAEQDSLLTRVEWFAYMLATVKHETGSTYQPIHEYGSRNYFIRRYGSQTAVGRRLGNDTPEEGAIYAGQGDVQLTGETNYEKAEIALRREYPELIAAFEARTGRHFDLTVGDQPNDINDPKNAQDPAIAYAIMSYGMRTGMFTGLSLKRYTTTSDFDEVEARRIINGTDKAELIAGYYRRFLKILVAARPNPFAGADIDINEIVGRLRSADVPANSLSGDETAIDPAIETPQTGLAIAGVNPPAEQPPTQNAEVIVNNGDTAASLPISENISLDAPPKDGATSSATKLVIAGVTVPGVLVPAIKGVQEALANGFVSPAEIGATLLGFIRDNQKYVFILIGLLIVLLIVKKLVKQVTFWISMLTHAIPGWNNVKILPASEPKPAYVAGQWRFAPLAMFREPPRSVTDDSEER